VINTVTNTVTGTIPIGQTSQALVYVPGAVPTGAGTDNLVPLGVAATTAHLHLSSAESALPSAGAEVAVNSLGLLDLLQIAAHGLAPRTQYQVSLVTSDRAPYGRPEPLAVLTTNPDGAGIAQAIGPLKPLAMGTGDTAAAPARRFLLVTELQNPSHVVLRQDN